MVPLFLEEPAPKLSLARLFSPLQILLPDVKPYHQYFRRYNSRQSQKRPADDRALHEYVAACAFWCQTSTCKLRFQKTQKSLAYYRNSTLFYTRVETFFGLKSRILSH